MKLVKLNFRGGSWNFNPLNIDAVEAYEAEIIKNTYGKNHPYLLRLYDNAIKNEKNWFNRWWMRRMRPAKDTVRVFTKAKVRIQMQGSDIPFCLFCSSNERAKRNCKRLIKDINESLSSLTYTEIVDNKKIENTKKETM